MIKILNTAILIGGLFILPACSATPTKAAEDVKQPAQTKQVVETVEPESRGREYALDFIDEFTRAKLRKNGEYLFCDQDDYLGCFKVTRSQCLQELAPLKDSCLERADKKFPDRMTNEKDIDRYASYFSVCMMLQHSADKDANDIGS